MKKVISCLLAILLLVSITCQSAVFTFAGETPTFTVSSETALPGQTVNVTIRMDHNPGIASIKLKATFDSALQLNSVTFNDEELGGTSQQPKKLTSPVTLLWINGLANTTGDMVYVTLQFTVSESASGGDHPITITYDEDDVYNIDEDNIAFAIVNGGVNVTVAVSGLALDCASATVETGDETFTLTPVFTPANASNQNVSWKSSDESVATVDGGVVTLLKKGSVTITATSEDGGFEASCALTVNCSHGTSHNVTAEASTCIAQGHGAYTVCDECGEIISGSDAKLPLGDHAYVENADAKYLASAATCNKAATYYKSCSVCGAASTETFDYGTFDAANHVGTTYKVNQKEATCYETGYTGDTYCSDCNAKLSSGTVIAKSAHNPASTWSTDAEYHWHDCQTVGCGNLIDKAAHSGGEATCVSQAICSVCHVAYGAVDPNNHKNTEIRDQKDATCCENGYTGDTYCKDCGVKIADGATIMPTANHVDADGAWENDGTQHWHTCYYGTKFDVTAHSGGTATCKDQAVCAICGASYGALDAANHVGGTETRDAVAPSCVANGYSGDTYCKGCGVLFPCATLIHATGDHVDADGKWETDGTDHWHTCSCGTKFDVTSHSGGTATCKDQAVCAVCGVSYGELNATNHVGGTYKLNQKEASCYEEGYTGDTYCADCNAKLSSGTVIAKSAHNPASTWSTDAEYHWHDCQTVGCGNLIDKAAHSGGEATCVSQAICSVCHVAYGSVDPNNHKNTEIRDQKAATCCENGYTGDTYCKDCGVKIASGTVINATGSHVDADGNWETDGTAHWHTCYYGTKFDVTSHSGGTATCKDQAVCAVCGTSYGALDAANHAGGTEIRDAVAPACTANGYSGDTYCLGCGVKLADGQILSKISHHITEWTISKAATVSESGEKTGVCTICSQEFKTVIEKLSSDPVADKNIAYEGMDTAPQLEPEGETVLPMDIIFVAEQIEEENLSAEQKAETEKAIQEVNDNLETIVGSGKKAESIDVICVLDLSLLIHNYDTVSGEDLGYEEYHFDGSVKVTIEIPEEMKSAKNPCLIHIKDDGTCEIVPFTDNGDGTISFTATGFSNYVLLDVETSAAPTSPKTGDGGNTGLWIALFAVSACGLALTVVGKKKKVK